MAKQPFRREVEQKEVPCPRCSGKAIINAYMHVEQGVCFKCRGTGTILAWVPKKEVFVR